MLAGLSQTRLSRSAGGFGGHAARNILTTSSVYLYAHTLTCAQGVVSREVTIMREMRHPNVLPLLASFTAGQHIWMVSPYYSAGSLQSIIEYAYPQVRGIVFE